jgi:hypothetical protein
MRYQFYREHKYIAAAINDVVRLLGKTDFTIRQEVLAAKHAFEEIVIVLKNHSHYEDERLHGLLRAKGSNIFAKVEDDHYQNSQHFINLTNRFNTILESTNAEEQIEQGYQCYLSFRKLAGDNLLHLNEEEVLVLPELQRLYNDAELREVDFESYRIMTAEELIHMLQLLFPHMNPADREAFLTDIKICDLEKFILVWHGIKPSLDQKEVTKLIDKLSIKE